MGTDISVIVPVHNAEKYLAQCVETLLNQTKKEIELIFVDDGSTDRSAEILESYRARDSRIQILKQENQYAGVARNNGLKAARGKYVIFLDADDYFAPRMLEQAFACAEKNAAQMVLFDYNYYDCAAESVKKRWYTKCPKGVFSAGALSAKEWIQAYLPVPWNKLFLREFIAANDLQFQAVKRSNDTYFTFMAFALAERIVHLRRRFVYYRINNKESLQGNVRHDRESYIRCGMSVVAELRQRGMLRGSAQGAIEGYNRELVHLSVKDIDDVQEMEKLYDFTKERLVPGLFAAPESWGDDQLLTNLWESRSFAEFLFNYDVRQDARHSMLDYRLGHALLALPRAVKHKLL